MTDQKGSSKTGILFIVSIIVLAVAFCGYCFWPNSPDEANQIAGNTGTSVKDTNNEPNHHDTGSKTKSDDEGANAEYVMVGGVRRKASDIRKPPKVDSSIPVDEEHPDPMIHGYGKTPAVNPDANPNTRSVAEAIKENKFPERLTPMVPPKPFDAKAFAKDPQAYLDVVEPGRAFAPAQPGKGVPRIKPLSPYFQKVEQGGTVKLQTTGKPGMPVTFTSLDLGQFSNQLTSVTVLANEKGIAEAEFIATPGTISDVRIIAASPVTSGQSRFIVNVHLPNQAN